MLPPAPLVLSGGLIPALGIPCELRVSEVFGLEIIRWADEALHVAARIEHEFHFPTEKAGRAMTRLPGADMVSLARKNIHVRIDFGQVDWRVKHFKLIGMNQRIAHDNIQKISMQLRRRFVESPFQNRISN